MDDGGREGGDPWLVRPGTIRGIRIVSLAVLAGLVALDFAVSKDGDYFGIQGGFGFAALYGVAVCAGIVAVSRFLGTFLKVRDDYYDD